MYSFPDLEPVMFGTRHVVACPVLTVASFPAYRFLTMKFTIKDRNDMDLREAEDIKKRW